jgi:hypothetical protein
LAGDEVVLGVGEVRRSPDAGVEDSDAVGVVPAVAPGEPHAPTKATKATIHVEDSLICNDSNAAQQSEGTAADRLARAR